jgi:hypothetical protein
MLIFVQFQIKNKNIAKHAKMDVIGHRKKKMNKEQCKRGQANTTCERPMRVIHARYIKPT